MGSSGLPALRTLWLNGTAVTDAGMAHLTGLPLSSIQIGQTQVGDAGLMLLGALLLSQLFLRWIPGPVALVDAAR